jgi:hypothetical protein
VVLPEVVRGLAVALDDELAAYVEAVTREREGEGRRGAGTPARPHLGHGACTLSAFWPSMPSLM